MDFDSQKQRAKVKHGRYSFVKSCTHKNRSAAVRLRRSPSGIHGTVRERFIGSDVVSTSHEITGKFSYGWYSDNEHDCHHVTGTSFCKFLLDWRCIPLHSIPLVSDLFHYSFRVALSE